MQNVDDISRVSSLPNYDPSFQLTRFSLQATEIVQHIMHELKLHTTYCESFGISVAEIQATEEKQGKPTSPLPVPSATLLKRL